MDSLNCEVTVTVLPIQGVEATRSLMIKACDEQIERSKTHLAFLEKHRQEAQATLAAIDLQERVERARIRRVLGTQARWKLVQDDEG